MLQNFEVSDLLGLGATDHRAIVLDLPGFEYSDRPRSST
jgi:hypothetical protein